MLINVKGDGDLLNGVVADYLKGGGASRKRVVVPVSGIRYACPSLREIGNRLKTRPTEEGDTGHWRRQALSRLVCGFAVCCHYVSSCHFQLLKKNDIKFDPFMSLSVGQSLLENPFKWS